MNKPPAHELATAFQQYFQIHLARSLEARQELYRLRYDVYCQEFGYEREEDCPGKMESDDYDDQAWHIMIRHTPTGKTAGSSRLIETGYDDRPTLPVERYCGDSLHLQLPEHPAAYNRDYICEISRMAIHTQFRRRPGENTPYGDIESFPFPERQIRTFPLLAAALITASAYINFCLKKEMVYVMMEPRFQKRLRQLGLNFRQIGELMEYHGKRAAYCIPVPEGLEAIEQSPILGPLYAMGAEQLYSEVRPTGNCNTQHNSTA